MCRLATLAFLSHSDLQHWLTDYGYAAVAALVAIESIGVPVPGESMLIVAAVYAGTTHRLSIAAVVAAAAAGAIVGDNVGYAVGRLGGWQLLRRYGHYVRIGESKLKLGRYLFMWHGGKVVFFGRFVGILRTCDLGGHLRPRLLLRRRPLHERRRRSRRRADRGRRGRRRGHVPL